MYTPLVIAPRVLPLAHAPDCGYIAPSKVPWPVAPYLELSRNG